MKTICLYLFVLSFFICCRGQQIKSESNQTSDLRLLNDEAIFTSVNNNSPASLAGIKPGYQLIEVNQKSIEQFISEKEKNPTPPFNDRNKRSLLNGIDPQLERAILFLNNH